MTKPRRSLEYKGSYDIPVDNVYVVRPDTIDREVPNLVINPRTNPNYGLFSTGIGYNMYGELVDYNNHRRITEEEAKQRAKEYATKKKVNRYVNTFNSYVGNNEFKDGGSIHIAPSKRGTFTAAATKHGMGVQEFASKVLRNKDDYSPSLVKKANFARNASKWNH